VVRRIVRLARPDRPEPAVADASELVEPPLALRLAS
jgi:hypothetical protein